MLQNYSDYVQSIQKEMDGLARLAVARQNTAARSRLQDAQDRLANNQFNLVVLGQFKRGKTTLINALLGAELLPTAVVPLTSIVTLLRYGKELQIMVEFLDGRAINIAQDALAGFVTEKGNPDNAKRVKQIEILFPSDYLKDGVVLVDTPGIGSVFEHNTDTTYDFIPKVDAALFLLSVDPPISKAESEFLKDIKADIQKVFFLLNKIDGIPQEDWAESLNFSRRVIQRELGVDTVKIYPVSARAAFEAKMKKNQFLYEKSLLGDFERVLARFLMEEKGKTLLLSTTRSGLRVLSELTLALELERKVLGTPLNELNRKLSRFAELLKKVQQDQEDNAVLLKGEISKLYAVIEQDLALFQKEQQPKLTAEVAEFVRSQRSLPVKDLSRAADERMQKAIIASLDRFRNEEEKKIAEEIGRITTRYQEKTNGIIKNIIDLSATIFAVPLQYLASDEALEADKGFYYKMGSVFPPITPLDASVLTALLPRAMAVQRVTNETVRKLDEQLDRNLGRVRYDFAERVKATLTGFGRRLDGKIDTVVDNIRLAIERATVEREKGEASQKRAAVSLESQIRTAGQVGDALNRIRRELGGA